MEQSLKEQICTMDDRILQVRDEKVAYTHKNFCVYPVKMLKMQVLLDI